MRIAVVGAGFAGMACVWTFLQNNKNCHVTLFDSKSIGSGASGVAAGLLHPYANAHSKLNREGNEGLTASMRLLLAAEEALGYKPFVQSGIWRPALSPIQESEFHFASQKHPENILWKESSEVQSIIPNCVPFPGILIKNGITVYPNEYLNGLWMACQKLGAHFQHHEVQTLQELNMFDRIIIATGSGCCTLKELAHLPLRYTKGQILEFLWPEELPPLPLALNGNVYCVMLPDKKRCLVGSTYEKQFSSSEANVETAKKLILPKLAQFFPTLANGEIVDCRAGIRVSTPQHLPSIQKINPKCYIITGFGSKGLLYHALYSQKLYESMGFSGLQLGIVL